MSKKPSPNETLPRLGKIMTWVDKAASLPKLVWGLGIVCAALFLADFVIHRHGHFAIEHVPGFYGLFGFAAFALIVLAAKALRVLIGRSEDYYAPNSVDSEELPQSDKEVINHGE